MFVLTRLKVHKFRGLTAPVDLHFSDGGNLVIGLNGSGKTNLLNLISAACRANFSAFQRESFYVEWEARTKDQRLRAAIRRDVTFASGRPEGGAPVLPTAAWDWRLAIRPRRGGVWREWAGRGTSGGGGDEPLDRIDPAGPEFLFRLAEPGDDWHVPITFAREHCRRMGEALDVFAPLVQDASDDGMSVLPCRVFVHPSKELTFTLSLPREWAPPLTRSQRRRIRDQRTLTLQPTDLPSLRIAAADLGAAAIQLVLTRDSNEADDAFVTFTSSELYVTFGDGKVVTPDRLSFGQKRMIALRHFISLVDDEPFIADELSNGLHHAWTESLLVSVAERQHFLASQNPLVMNAVAFDSPSAAQRSLIVCQRAEDDAWTWRQLTAAEGRELAGAYNREVQQVHEILRTRGWW